MSKVYRHTARVVETVDNDYIKVELVPMSACTSCSIASSCCGGEELSNKKYFVLYNNMNVKTGDEVVISISQKNLIKSVSIVYIIPIVMLLFVAIVSDSFFKKDIYTALSSLIFLIVYFFGLKLLLKNRDGLDVKIIDKKL